MVISELIKELENKMKQYGDVEVEISASYDCGYGYAGGYIEEIEMGKSSHYCVDENGMYVRDENGVCLMKEYDVLNLCNNEG